MITTPTLPPPPVIVTPPAPLLPPPPPPPFLPINIEVDDVVVDDAAFIIFEDTVLVLDTDMAKRLKISHIYCFFLHSPDKLSVVNGKNKNI